MTSKLVMVLVTLLVVGVGAMFLLGNKSNYMQQTTTTSSPAPTSSMDSQMEASPSVAVMEQEVMVTISGMEFKFEPSTLTFKKGQKVKLTLKNTGKYPHDFVVEDLDVRTKVLKAGEEETIEFTPEKVGKFEFICSVGNHAAMGMKGMLTVE